MQRPVLLKLHASTYHQHGCSPPHDVHGQGWPAHRCALSVADTCCNLAFSSKGQGRQRLIQVHAATQDAQKGFHQQRFAAQLLSRPQPLIRLELIIRQVFNLHSQVKHVSCLLPVCT